MHGINAIELSIDNTLQIMGKMSITQSSPGMGNLQFFLLSDQLLSDEFGQSEHFDLIMALDKM